MNISGKYFWPAAAILAGGIAAWVTQSSPKPSTATYAASEPLQTPARNMGQAPNVHGDPAEESQGERLQGKVLEIINVPNYTYLRLTTSAASGDKPSDGVWAAVSTAEAKVGQAVTIVGAQRMENFASSTLKRSFEVIYFGALENGNAGSGTDMQQTGKLPPGHPDIGAGPNASGQAPADPARAAQGAAAPDPHGSPSSGGEQVPVGKVERAKGKLGHSVSELVNGRKSFVGQQVRVHAIVVKSTSGVLGKTFLHLRDGSGDTKSHDNDLTVTTDQTPAVGSSVLVEGTVVTDKDFGAGYSYPVLVENAQLVTE